MKQRLLPILFLLLALQSSSQDKTAIIKFSPLPLIDDASFPTVQGGIEISLSQHVSWYNEFGIRYRKGYYERVDTTFVKANGFKARSEARYYLNSHPNRDLHKRMEGFYIGVNIFYTKEAHNTAILYHHKLDTINILLDNFAVEKIIFGGNFLAGGQLVLDKRLFLDVYGGLGIRFRNIMKTNSEFDQDRDMIRGPHDLNFHGQRNRVEARAGRKTLPNFTMGLRIGYAF